MRYFEILLGLRYTRAKRRNHFISVSSILSILGFTIGVAALIIVMSVMNGFQKEIRAKILGASSHLELSANPSFTDWPFWMNRMQRDPAVVGAAPFISQQGLLTREGTVRGAMVRGVVPQLEAQVADFSQHMLAGSLNNLRPGEFGVVLGSELAGALGVGMGDKVVLLAPEGNVTPAGVMPRLKQFRVVGVFRLDLYPVDSGLAMINMVDAQRLYRLGDAVNGVRFKLQDPMQARTVKYDWMSRLPPSLFLSDWTDQNAAYFQAVEMEKVALTLILLLIILVAAINVISTLVMLVVDKQSDIAILRTIGATPKSIMIIFMIQGAVIGCLGTLLGVLIGVPVAINVGTLVSGLEHLLGVHFLSGEVYLVSELPSDLHWNEVGWVVLVALGFSLLATIYPSWRAARVQPAEALRYE